MFEVLHTITYDQSTLLTSTRYMRFFFAVFLAINSIFKKATADFVYKDFNETTGLIFNGAAGTTSCWNDPARSYATVANSTGVHGKADVFQVGSVIEREERTDYILESTITTSIASENAYITENLAGYLHRSNTKSAPTACSVRARLTPSNPSTTGSMWFRDYVPVSNGFDTYFTFQITDHSKSCTLVKDQYLSQSSYQTCSVHGGDGFAFLIQLSPEGTNVLGADGGQIGLGGIENSLAIAFDTWQNPGLDLIGVDKISVLSNGVSKNDAFSGLLGIPRVQPLADGVVHLARIVYFGDLRSQYFDQLIVSDSLLPFLKDNGEQKRVGTLVVFMDDGIASDTPLLALPINLSLLLNLPDDKAFVGFTSSTGRFYEKHDILSWVWCDQEPCDPVVKGEFDYHQSSKFFPSSKQQDFQPGPGFGGNANPFAVFPIKNTNPDTTAWEKPMDTFSTGRNIGLSTVSSSQVPPATLY